MTVTPGKSTRAARAVEALLARHAELREVLDHWAGALADAADSGRPARPVRNLLHAFLADEVLPHARAEERTLYRAARRDPDTSLLVQALISEDRDLAARAAALGEPAPSAAVAARGRGDQRFVRQSRGQGGLPSAARAGAFRCRRGRPACPGAPPGGQPVRGMMRRLWPDRNLLRRAAGRAEAAVMAGLLAMFLAGVPLAAVAAAGWAAANGMHAERAQARWRQVPAVLLQDAPEPAHALSQASLEPLVPARWTAPGGALRKGEIYAPGGARAGTTVMVWTDTVGNWKEPRCGVPT